MERERERDWESGRERNRGDEYCDLANNFGQIYREKGKSEEGPVSQMNDLMPRHEKIVWSRGDLCFGVYIFIKIELGVYDFYFLTFKYISNGSINHTI